MPPFAMPPEIAQIFRYLHVFAMLTAAYSAYTRAPCRDADAAYAAAMLR